MFLVRVKLLNTRFKILRLTVLFGSNKSRAVSGQSSSSSSSFTT